MEALLESCSFYSRYLDFDSVSFGFRFSFGCVLGHFFFSSLVSSVFRFSFGCGLVCFFFSSRCLSAGVFIRYVFNDLNWNKGELCISLWFKF